MDKTSARYEFRVFAPHMGTTELLLRRLATCESITENTDIYLLDCNNARELNVKIRQSKLDIKRLVSRHCGLEQWRPEEQLDFPLTLDTFSTLWGSQSLKQDHARSSSEFSLDKLLRIATEPTSHLQKVNVFKRRYRFTLAHCSAELDYLLVNGASMESIAIESENPDAVIETLSAIRLEGFENQCYPLMICRLLGRLPMQDEEAFGH